MGIIKVIKDARYAFAQENPDEPLTDAVLCPDTFADEMMFGGMPPLIYAIRKPLSESSIALLVTMGFPVDELYRDHNGNHVTPVTEAVAASRVGYVGLATVRLLVERSSARKIQWAYNMARDEKDVPAPIRTYLFGLAHEVPRPPRKVRCTHPEAGVHGQPGEICDKIASLLSMSD